MSPPAIAFDRIIRSLHCGVNASLWCDCNNTVKSARVDISPEVGTRQYLTRQEPFSQSPHSGVGCTATGVALPVAAGFAGGSAVIFTAVCSQEQTRTGSAHTLTGVPVEKRQTHRRSLLVTARGDQARRLKAANRFLVTSGGEEWRPGPSLEVANTQLPTSGGDAWRPGPSLL